MSKTIFKFKDGSTKSYDFLSKPIDVIRPDGERPVSATIVLDKDCEEEFEHSVVEYHVFDEIWCSLTLKSVIYLPTKLYKLLHVVENSRVKEVK